MLHNYQYRTLNCYFVQLPKASLEVREAGRRTLNSLAPAMPPSDTITILHYNDVYNVEKRKNADEGGASRMCTAFKKCCAPGENPLVLFSGDAFSPSMLSTCTKGAQMVPVLNAFGTHCAVFGNHDFDFGLEILSERVADTKFPWLMSNVIDNETGRPLGDGKITHVIEWAGKRIGLVGLVEREWLDTLSTINPDEVTFLDFVDAGKNLGAQLKHEGCDLVIALTHMRLPNDEKLAKCCDEIDLILGGHDHIYLVNKVNGKYVVKSGTDFHNFSKIYITFENGPNVEVSINEIKVDSSYDEDEQLSEELEKYTVLMEGKLDEVLGEFTVELDGRFESIRKNETNLGNWVCDVVLAATGADLVILNSGTFRSDRIHLPGPFTMRDLMSVVPLTDPIVVLEVTGEQIVTALENGVSSYPKLEGRFPQVGGIQFAFYEENEPGTRVERGLIKVGDEYLRNDSRYRLATKTYLAQGSDGYSIFKNCRTLVDEEGCPELGIAIQNHFEAIKMRLGKCKRSSKHRQSLVTLSRRHSLIKMLDGEELDGPPPLRKSYTICQEGALPRSHFTRRASLDDLEQHSCLLAPEISNRIMKLNSELRDRLILEKERLQADTVIQEEPECQDV
ncbi:5'-nucleotidase isoform X2 [Rhodnius prolixus]|uniref:5'-nucleotidase isoform X2 n=1 Tax=Rhodnius prolixus TaxID=13249 RepID=UPI003D18F5D3